MDRLRHLVNCFSKTEPTSTAFFATAFWGLVTLAPVLTLGTACQDRSKTPPPSRFAAVRGNTGNSASKVFCEKSYPASGPDARTFDNPPERPLGAAARTARGQATWRWINLWATWCTPCMAEIPLLGRWQKALETDGITVQLEFWSVDDDEALLRAATSKLPGQVRWLRSPEDLDPLLQRLEIDKGAALPIHLLISDRQQLRCVRVGAVHDSDFGTIKTLLSQ